MQIEHTVLISVAVGVFSVSELAKGNEVAWVISRAQIRAEWDSKSG